MNSPEVIISFLKDLSEHNDRYIQFKEVSDAFSLKFLEKMSAKDRRLLYMICSGLYCPTSATVRSVREEIMLSGEEFEEAFRKCRGFDFEWDTAYRRVPPGYSKDDRYSDYYRLRTYVITRFCDEKQFLSDDLIDTAVRELTPTIPFNILLDRCVDYGREMGWEKI